MISICIIVGARPNFVKVAPLIRAIEKTDGATYTLIYAGSEDDTTIESSLFDDLEMPRPQVFLGVESSKLNEITAQVMERFDHFLDSNKADVVIVVDDLASTMAAAIVTKKRGLKLAHLVAGTRSFDIKMPKEVNRLVIDALSDYLFTAGMRSNSVATREGGDTGQTFMVGNILMDSLRFCKNKMRKPQCYSQLHLEENKYIVLTINRKRLIEDAGFMRRLVTTLEQSGLTVVAPLRGQANETVRKLIASDSNINLIDSLPYLEFGFLSAQAGGMVTDSGNVSEEATFNGVPCITLNSYTEHIETVTVGTNVLVGGDTILLGEELKKLKDGQWKTGHLPNRWDGRTAERIVGMLIADSEKD